MFTLLALLACTDKPADTDVTDPEDSASTLDSAPPDTGPSGDGGDSGDTGADTGADTHSDTDTGEALPPLKDPVSALSAVLHDPHQSMIYASWTQREEARRVYVEYSVDEGVWEVSPTREGALGEHTQIVVGVPYEHEVTWRVISEVGEQQVASADQVITTGARPAELPRVEVDVSRPELWDANDRFLLTTTTERDAFDHSSADFWLVILDRKGRVVWSKTTPRKTWTLFAKPSRDGEALLHDESTYWTAFDGGLASRVHRIKLDDTVELTWDTPGLHHSFDDLEPETIVWMGQDGVDDYLYRSEGTRQPEVRWRCLEWLEDEGITLDPEIGRNYCGANAISWYEPRDTYVISLFSHETVLELDLDGPASGVLWYAERPGGAGLTLPEDARWEWQHDAQIIDGDRLLLSSGVKSGDGPGFPGGQSYDHTVVYEYVIDEPAGELALAWSHHSEPEWVSQYKGGVWRLPNGNTTHYFGDFPGFKEIAPDGEIAWQLRFVNDEDPWIGRSTFIDDLYPFAE